MRVELAAIQVPPRRRDDLGDLEGLAASLARYGLIEPIVLDDDLTLVAGQRRLEAAKRLAWTHIEARLYGELTEEERWAIELEENLQRKALTPGERAKRMVRQAQQMATRLSSVVEEKTPRGHQRTYAVPKEAVAQALGVSVGTLVNAEKHVAAVTKYPELNLPGMTQQGAVTVAKNLDALPEDVRAAQRAAIRRRDMDVLAVLSEVPPLPKEDESPAREVGQRWLKLLHELSIRMGGIARHGGMGVLAEAWPPRQRAEARDELRRIVDILGAWADALEEQGDGETTDPARESGAAAGDGEV